MSRFLARVAQLLLRLSGERESCCDSDYCKAYRWPACVDGRCRHHCQLQCDCARAAAAATTQAARGTKAIN